MIEDFSKIAEALDVPLRWLLTVMFGGFTALAITIVSSATGAAVVSAVAGVLIVGTGVRAMVRPARPFDPASLTTPSSLPYVNSSRRLGGFYVLCGVVWLFVTVGSIAA